MYFILLFFGHVVNPCVAGLQTQSATKPDYAGPFDAMRKIWSSHGLRGIYKGQVATLWREASGYGVYFWAYERLVKRELATKGGRREDISPAKAVLFGAGAGYAVRAALNFLNSLILIHNTAMGGHLPY